MTTQKRLALVAASALLGLSANFACASATEKGVQSYLNGSLTADEEFTVASFAAKALRHLATARRDIAHKNIPGAQSQLGKALA